MAVKTVQKTKKVQSKHKKEVTFPLEKENFVIIGIGIFFLVIGYIFMSENSVDGFLPTIIAPILLVLGYCVIIPYGILKKPPRLKKPKATAGSEQNITTVSSSKNVNPNIKTS